MFLLHRSSCPVVFCKKGVLRNFANVTGKHLCQSLFFNKEDLLINPFINKETLTQMFSCEFCEISKCTFFYRTPLVATLSAVQLLVVFFSMTSATSFAAPQFKLIWSCADFSSLSCFLCFTSTKETEFTQLHVMNRFDSLHGWLRLRIN